MHQLAESIRARFDRIPRWIRFGIVGLLVLITVLVANGQLSALSAGCGVKIRVLPLELAFSAQRFARLLPEADACKRTVINSLVGWDVWFPLSYGPTLCAVYLVSERRDLDGSSEAHRAVTGGTWRNLAVLAPLVAAVLDLVAENLPLWQAGTRILLDAQAEHLTSVKVLVALGSIGAALKWALIVFSACTIVVALWMNLMQGRAGEGPSVGHR